MSLSPEESLSDPPRPPLSHLPSYRMNQLIYIANLLLLPLTAGDPVSQNVHNIRTIRSPPEDIEARESSFIDPHGRPPPQNPPLPHPPPGYVSDGSFLPFDFPISLTLSILAISAFSLYMLYLLKRLLVHCFTAQKCSRTSLCRFGLVKSTKKNGNGDGDNVSIEMESLIGECCRTAKTSISLSKASKTTSKRGSKSNSLTSDDLHQRHQDKDEDRDQEEYFEEEDEVSEEEDDKSHREKNDLIVLELQRRLDDLERQYCAKVNQYIEVNADFRQMIGQLRHKYPSVNWDWRLRTHKYLKRPRNPFTDSPTGSIAQSALPSSVSSSTDTNNKQID